MIYKLQELRGNSFSDFSGEYLTFPVMSLKDLPLPLGDELSLLPTYDQIQVPIIISNLVNDFCNTHSLEIIPAKIITLIGGAQKLVRGSQNIVSDDSDVQDFFNEGIELRSLLGLIKKYKFSRENLDLKSVRFIKSENKTIETYKNTWILQRIFDSLMVEMNLDAQSPEEFDLQAEAEISKTSLAKPTQLEYYIKGIAIKAFRHYINNIPDVSNSYRNNCAGVFLNCAQIQITPHPIILSPIFEDNLWETDPKHVYQLLRRLPKSFI